MEVSSETLKVLELKKEIVRLDKRIDELLWNHAELAKQNLKNQEHILRMLGRETREMASIKKGYGPHQLPRRELGETQKPVNGP